MDSNAWHDKQRERWERRRERRERRCAEHQSTGIFWGLIVTAVGVLFLLRNLDIFYFDSIWQFWPVILIVIGISKLSTSAGQPGGVFTGLLLMGLGAVFLLQSLHYLPGQIWQYVWPGILIAVGLAMLARHLDWGLPPPAAAPPPSGAAPPPEGSPANRLHIEVVFGGDRRALISDDFEGGKIAAIFGGVEVDLRRAATRRKEVVVHADAVFGGVELLVPEAWRTEVRGSGVFGGYLDKTHRPHQPPDPDAPRLIVRGGAVFGSVIVRN
jgi:hypothetical protein